MKEPKARIWARVVLVVTTTVVALVCLARRDFVVGGIFLAVGVVGEIALELWPKKAEG